MKQINKIYLGIIVLMLISTSLSIAGSMLPIANKQVELNKQCNDILKTKNITIGATDCLGNKCEWKIYVDGIEKDTWGLEGVTDFRVAQLTSARDEVITYQTQKLCDEYLSIKQNKTSYLGEGIITTSEIKK